MVSKSSVTCISKLIHYFYNIPELLWCEMKRAVKRLKLLVKIVQTLHIITQSIKWDDTHPWYVEICCNVAIIKYPAITRKIAQNGGIKAYV